MWPVKQRSDRHSITAWKEAKKGCQGHWDHISNVILHTYLFDKTTFFEHGVNNYGLHGILSQITNLKFWIFLLLQKLWQNWKNISFFRSILKDLFWFGSKIDENCGLELKISQNMSWKAKKVYEIEKLQSLII